MADGAELIWGYDLTPEGVVPFDDTGVPRARGALRWMHANLSDLRVQRWVHDTGGWPQEARELLLSKEDAPRALVLERWVACVLPDVARRFDDDDDFEIGSIRCLVGPALVFTCRYHPVRCADRVRTAIDRGARPVTQGAALDLLVSSIIEIAATTARDLNANVQRIEDALLDQGRQPNPRALIAVRRRGVQLHRQIDGLRGVLHRLEEDEDLSDALLPTVEKLAQRAAGLNGEILTIQSNTRQLRDELDLQTTQRTNQNLYILSILSALLLPATLVTGIFGMNTGGLPFAGHSYGTAFATALAVGSAFAVYLFLRFMGYLGGRRN